MIIQKTSDVCVTPPGYMRSVTTFEDRTNRVGRLIPLPRIPVQPVLSCRLFRKGDGEKAASVLDYNRALYVTAGRVAAAHALVLSGLMPGEKVLVPAYHCIAMVEPIVQLGGVPVFYRIREDLSVDLEDVVRKLDARTRIFLAVNYFGFPQDLCGLRKFCDGHGLTFIEDCAHSFFGSHRGRALGTFGDYAIASLPKFFAVREGGCLIVNTHNERLPSASRSQGVAANLAAVFDSIDDAVHFGRLRLLKPFVAAADLTKGAIKLAVPAFGGKRRLSPAEQRSGQTAGFDLSWMEVKATAISRFVTKYSSHEHIARVRRRHYASLANAFTGNSRCRPLLPWLPEGVIPYMFPLWVDHLADIFPALEDHAIPMQRFGQFLWPTCNEDFCAVSRQFSEHVLLLPCHQELTDSEVAALVAKVQSVANH